VTGPVLLQDLLEEGAGRHPDRVALVHRDEGLSYTELDRLAGSLAAELARRGVGEGDRVALLLESSHELAIALFGVWKAGAAAVPIDLPIVARELLHHLRDCTPKVLLTDRRREYLAEGALRELESPPALVAVERSALSAGGDPGGAAARPSPESMACLLYTSGTTGEPKGVMLSHRNLLANCDSIVGYLPLEPDDRTMLVLPLTHSYGLSVLTTRLRVGATVILDNRFAFPNVVLEAMKQHGATAFAGVPSHYAMLLRRSALRKMELPALRYLTQAGGPLPPAMIRELLDALPHVKLFVMYGQTEASARLSFLPPERLLDKMGSIGRGIPGVELEVRGEDGRPVPPGETGEIVARGPNVMMGYWNAPEETARVLRDGWLHTGDLARVDEDGFVTIVGREKEMIKSGGYRTSPLEIEEVACQVPGIAECAAVGMPDAMFGERITLFVVPREGAEVPKDEILALCKRSLAPHKVPSGIELVDSLPKTPSGKVKRAELRKPRASPRA